MRRRRRGGFVVPFLPGADEVGGDGESNGDVCCEAVRGRGGIVRARK